MSAAPAAIPLVDLKAQHAEIAEEVARGMARVMDETSFILGPAVRAFEEAFARFCQVPHCIGVGNGTDALEFIVRAAGLGPGDEPGERQAFALVGHHRRQLTSSAQGVAQRRTVTGIVPLGQAVGGGQCRPRAQPRPCSRRLTAAGGKEPHGFNGLSHLGMQQHAQLPCGERLAESALFGEAAIGDRQQGDRVGELRHFPVHQTLRPEQLSAAPSRQLAVAGHQGQGQVSIALSPQPHRVADQGTHPFALLHSARLFGDLAHAFFREQPGAESSGRGRQPGASTGIDPLQRRGVPGQGNADLEAVEPLVAENIKEGSIILLPPDQLRQLRSELFGLPWNRSCRHAASLRPGRGVKKGIGRTS